MKERYFTPDTIVEKSGQMLRSLHKYSERHREEVLFRPERCALMVLDMQKYFLEEGSHAFIPSAPAIVPNIRRLAAAFATLDMPVILTRHINTKEDAGLMGSWWKDIIRGENDHSEIIPELRQWQRGAGAFPVTLEKTRYDAFHGTVLETLLRDRDISQLVITGVMTHLCVETTARSAFMRGFEVFLPVDGTATCSEDFHRASFLNLSHGFAVPVLMDELYGSLEVTDLGD